MRGLDVFLARSPRPGAAVALGLLALAGRVWGAAPPLVPWREAGAHVGNIVTVEGEVVAARTTADACVLEFAAEDPHAFRAVLLLPLLSSLPPHPERLYLGRRVRVSGRMQRFQGRPEMVLRGPAQIEVIDVAAAATPGDGAPTAAPAPASPRAAVPEPAAPPDAPGSPPAAPAASEPAAPEPPPQGLGEAVARRLARIDSCDRARARWREAAGAARERAAILAQCLDAGGYRCRTEAAAIAPALSALEWAEQQVESTCR
jgi:hypothetical protein